MRFLLHFFAPGKSAADSASPTLETRLLRLERERRLTRGLLLGLALLLGGSWFQAATQPVQEVVRARRFELLDTEGRPLAALLSDLNGNSKLWLHNAQGERSVSLGSDTDGDGGFWLNNAQGKPSTFLGSDPNGGALWLNNAQGKKTIVLGSEAYGGVLSLRNAQEKKSVVLGTLPDSTGFVGVYDREGELRATTMPRTLSY